VADVVPILIVMVVVVVVAVLVLTYAAYPHRGAPVPGASWIGRLMTRAVRSVPTIRDETDSRR